MRRRGLLAAVAVAGAAACSETGILGPPPGYVRPAAAPCPVHSTDLALACFAPVLLQEQAPPADHFDVPTVLDPDGSGELKDDAYRVPEGFRPTLPVPYYAAASADDERIYLLYALYYPVDWSGDPRQPRFDHLGDVEGALIVASRATGLVEAVITQAHDLFYVFTPSVDPPSQPGVSGTVALTPGGRVILFAESGGHGVYAYGSGNWNPQGGTHYAHGPAGVPADRLFRIDPDVTAAIRPLEDLRRFTDERGAFRDLPRGAKPPWLWRDKRGGVLGEAGAIVVSPGKLYAALLSTPRP